MQAEALRALVGVQQVQAEAQSVQAEAAREVEREVEAEWEAARKPAVAVG